MKTRIYIVRHTQTVGNIEKRLTGRKDYEVTDQGQIYISKLTQRLKEVKFDKAYTSTSKRTSKTIQELADLNGLKIIEEDGLCEMYFGIYDGKTWEEVNRIDPKIHKLHQETNEICEIPTQETTQEVTKRMYDTICRIVNENVGKNILICSHGVAIEAFLRKITKVPFTEQIQQYSQKNTSLNIVIYDDDTKEFKVELLNAKEYIEEGN